MHLHAFKSVFSLRNRDTQFQRNDYTVYVEAFPSSQSTTFHWHGRQDAAETLGLNPVVGRASRSRGNCCVVIRIFT